MMTHEMLESLYDLASFMDEDELQAVIATLDVGQYDAHVWVWYEDHCY